MFPDTSKTTPPTVFNLQASDWVHCEEETGVCTELSQNTYKLVSISKNSIKFIIHFFQKMIILHTHIFTKCIDKFKFSVSLKSNEE